MPSRWWNIEGSNGFEGDNQFGEEMGESVEMPWAVSILLMYLNSPAPPSVVPVMETAFLSPPSPAGGFCLPFG